MEERLFPHKSNGGSTNDVASGWSSLTGVSTMSSLQCTDTVGWTTGRRSELYNLSELLSPKFLFQNKWRKKIQGNTLIQVHLKIAFKMEVVVM